MLRVILLVAVFGARSFGQQPETILQQAITHHRAGEYQQAIQGYREYLNLRPDSPEARSNLGAALAHEGQFDEAIREYQQALRAMPGNPGVEMNLALAYYKTGRLPAAADLLAGARKRLPDNHQITLLLADCWLRMGENGKVIGLLTPISAQNHDDLGVAYLLGTALLNDKQTQKAQEFLDRILRNGDSAEARLLMGTAKLGVMDYAGALKEFKRAVELNPKLPSAHSYYGQALMATGDAAGASKEFRAELAENPTDFEANLDLATLLRQDQHYDEAMALLARSLRVRPGDLRVRYQQATIELAQGKLETARKNLEDIVRQAPQFTEAHVSLATVYYRLKRKEDGDRERAVVQKLNAEAQARQPGAKSP